MYLSSIIKDRQEYTQCKFWVLFAIFYTFLLKQTTKLSSSFSFLEEEKIIFYSRRNKQTPTISSFVLSSMEF